MQSHVRRIIETFGVVSKSWYPQNWPLSNILCFQQHKATIDPSILHVSCMQPSVDKTMLAFAELKFEKFGDQNCLKKVGNRLFNLQMWRDLVNLGS